MKATIVYIIDPDTHEVLMAKKMKKVGVGYWFGYGGKLEDGETALECICRETFQESGNVIQLDPNKLEPVALISFFKGQESNPRSDEALFEVLCYRIFVKKAEIGTPEGTDEMANPTWFPLIRLPLEEMKSGDELFVPQILLGTPVKGYIHFSSDSKEVLAASIIPCAISDLTLVKAA
jgi:ADP-ribose pyrophosphatase YjhB (NUDIX family)